MDWTTEMFFWSVVGAVAGLWYPLLVAVWRKEMSGLYALGLERTRLSRGARAVLRWLLLGALGVTLGIIIAAVGFGSFLADPARRRELESLGTLAFFTAASYGFSAGSLVAEPLKGGRGRSGP